MTRPYLIIPQLIEQPNWGGSYILELKHWNNNPSYSDKKIGQSYELTGSSQLSKLVDSTDPVFSPQSEGFPIQDVLQKNESMPLLIKINQALGNSFQLHIKPETQSNRWLPKPESWYFLEPGFISLGLKEGAHVEEYKKTCEEIDGLMQDLSNEIKLQMLSLEEARTRAHDFIQAKNPWQFINTYKTEKYDLIDLSMGAIHHSWEENPKEAPLGNIVYEVQLDVSDDQATVRSFDQGKIKDDGTVRMMNIDDYFEHLDTTQEHNSLEYMKRTQNGDELLRTRFYSVDLIEVTKTNNVERKTNKTFHHLYVRDGDVRISAGGTTIRVTKGHSCFIPSSVESYAIDSLSEVSVLLKTFVG
ncbi:hypothetical protein KBD81_01280 [Candidatus Woesebacteria bacterium]|nr:hypothetical protein [Candidatus Woesebacteria bacterium]